MSSPTFLPAQLPDGWTQDRIRDRLRRVVGGDWGVDAGSADELVDVVVVRVADMNGIGIALTDPTIRAVTPYSLETRRLRSDSLVLEKSGGGEKQNVGRVALAGRLDRDAICSNFMAVMDVDGATSSSFLNYAFSALYDTDMNLPSVKQTTGIQNLDVIAYLSTQIAFPSQDEQQRIAAYLDASCLAIDAAVMAKREQIETLTNHFAMTVHRAVTAGLDASCKMVDSQQSWLGEVPRHWTPTRIRNVAALSPGYSGAHFPQEDSYVVVPMECVSEMGDMVLSEHRSLEDVGQGMVVFEHGDVLFAKITPCMENGKGAFVPELPTPLAFGSTEFHVLRPTHRIDGTFLYYYTWNPVFRAYAAENMMGAAGQKRVSSRFLKDVRLFLPPMPEQIAISKHLVAQRGRNLDMKTCIEDQIAVLMAYRKSLIHECVTGQRRIADEDVNRVTAHAASLA